MYKIINGIELDEVQKRITDIISDNYLKFDKLSVDIKDVKKLPLENIWKDVKALKNKKKLKVQGKLKINLTIMKCWMRLAKKTSDEKMS